MAYHRLEASLQRGESFNLENNFGTTQGSSPPVTTYPFNTSYLPPQNVYAANNLQNQNKLYPNQLQTAQANDLLDLLPINYMHNNVLREQNLMRDDDGLFKLTNNQYSNNALSYSNPSFMPPLTPVTTPCYSSVAPLASNNTPFLSDIKDEFPKINSHNNEFKIELRNKLFPKELYKRQKRLKGISEQRIENGNIEIILNFFDPLIFQSVKSIQVEVKRTNELAGTHKYIGAVNLEPSFQILSSTEYLVKVDLDSVYEKQGKKVYELQKTLTKELNLFHLIVTVTLKDSRQTVKETQGFLLIGKKSVKRSRDERKESVSSADSPILSPKRSPSSGYATPTSPQMDEDIIRAQSIVADHISTKSLEFDKILYANKFQSPNGDIAYHFEVHDPTIVYEEGEVIGFLPGGPDGVPQIIKLTSAYAGQAVLKGVVTRSQYFEARKPKDKSVVTETVCMMGIVPVRVQGSVAANDALYASPCTPGAVVSGKKLSYLEKQDAALIGYAFQSLKVLDEEELGMVKAGVSVLNSASQVLLNRRLRSMNTTWNDKLDNLKRSNKRLRKIFCFAVIFGLIFAILLGIFLWQSLAPGTRYRYFKCKQGSLQGRSSSYEYAANHGYDKLKVNGIEFEFEKLMSKTDHDYIRMIDANARYYLNIDRCAYGGIRTTPDQATGLKRVSGPELFAVNHDCTIVKQYFEVIHNWTTIKSTTKEKCTFNENHSTFHK